MGYCFSLPGDYGVWIPWCGAFQGCSRVFPWLVLHIPARQTEPLARPFVAVQQQTGLLKITATRLHVYLPRPTCIVLLLLGSARHPTL